MKRGSGRALRILLITLVGLIAGFVWIVNFAYDADPAGKKVTLDQVFRYAGSRQVVSATLLDQDAQVAGKRCASGTVRLSGGGAAGCSGRVVSFYSPYPQSNVTTQALIDALNRSGAAVTVDKQTNKAVGKLVATFIFPLAMLANLFGIIFVSRAGDSSLADIAGFGTIRRRRQRRQRIDTGVTFGDVAGAEEAVAELKEVTEYLTDPERFEAYGASPPKGVLLFGPPGCGKTLLARAAAGETGVAFFSISGAEFVESLVGVGAARVRDLFRQVRECAPAIVFIDEIDAVGRKRSGEGMTGGEREQTVNQLLVEMDGFEVSSGIVVMAATNRPDILDAALLRPGRFDRHIRLQAPDVEGRTAILELHAQSKPVAADVDFAFVAQRTPGFTGADLANVVNEAALLALREGNDSQMRSSHFSEAIVRVLHGPQRRGKLMSAEERRRIAVHESGHAIVGAALGSSGDHQRLSIVARGRGLGSSVVSEDADKVVLTEDEMECTMAVAMAGLAAEALAFGDRSTAAEDDLEKANSVAREMVGRFGMSTRVGGLRILASNDTYLGADAMTADVVSEASLKEFDDEVKRLLDVARRKAAQVLEWNRHLLAELSEGLEEHETLEDAALEEYLRNVQVEMDVISAIGAESGNGDGRRPLTTSR